MLRWRRHHKWGSSDSEGYPDIYYRLHRLERVKKTSLKHNLYSYCLFSHIARSWKPMYRHTATVRSVWQAEILQTGLEVGSSEAPHQLKPQVFKLNPWLFSHKLLCVTATTTMETHEQILRQKNFSYPEVNQTKNTHKQLFTLEVSPWSL